MALPTRNLTLSGGEVITIYNEQAVEECIKTTAGRDRSAIVDDAVLVALSSENDVVAGVIEGGFTIWEGTWHLLEHLKQESVDFAGKSVLDLGCGGGLLGLFALLHGASSVTFQEYNEVILKAWVIPNVTLLQKEFSDRTSFISGDWEDLAKFWMANETTFDIVLSAETIYRPELYSKLHTVLEAICAPSDGGSIVYLVSKLKYYGPGGDACDFGAFLDRNGVFSYKLIQLTTKGTSFVCFEIKRKS
ncbi:unnamed protein product [Mesocestoides corti]|nr:unnamed protein product [Mesocestoides corti]